MVFLACLSFCIAFLASLAIVSRIRGHAKRYSHTMPQRFHAGDVPRLGGLAIYLGLLCGWGAAVIMWMNGNVSNVPVDVAVLGVWAATLLPALAGGVAEDLTQRLRVRYRMLLTSLSALLAIFLLGIALPRFGVAAVDEVLHSLPWLGMGVALLAVTGLPHAFNIIDGYNGIAGMVAVVVCLALVHVALQVGDRQLAGMLLCLVGATGGFLVWNYPRGMVFAGDGGAYLWGVTIAVASLLLVQRHDEVSPWFPMLLMIYPVWETLFSIYRKLARGISPSVADALHFHQLIYRRIVHGVFHDDESRRILMRNNRTSPYLWAFTLLTVVPAVMFWRSTPVLMAFCALFVLSYVSAYLTIIRFKVPRWLRR
jgi:UDP-N-acetylmuramyl pentapeptide phosphotransferase/UDP-N-acetylglucosamine-1-phosphate transferase